MAFSLPKYQMSWLDGHAHVWIDPELAAKDQVSIRPYIGDGPDKMNPGKVYRCRRCGQEIEIPIHFKTALA